MIQKGKESGPVSSSRPATADDVYMFSYTSGTTGDPKGVKLTHKAMLSMGESVNAHLRERGPKVPLTE